jgi:hypothetical protein
MSALVDRINQGSNVASVSFGNVGSHRDNMHFPSPGKSSSVGLLHLLLVHLGNKIANCRLSLFAVRNGEVKDLINPSHAASIHVHRMKLDVNVSERIVSAMNEDACRKQVGDWLSTASTIPDSESWHYVAVLRLPADQVVMLIDCVPSELTSRKSILSYGESVSSYINRSTTCMGEVLNAICLNRLRVPMHRADITALLQLVARGRYHIFFGCHVVAATECLEECFFALNFASKIGTLKAAAINPFGRDIRIDKCVLERELRRLTAELAVAHATHGIAQKLSSAELSDVEAIITIRKEANARTKAEHDAEVKRLVDHEVARVSQERLKELRLQIRESETELADLSSKISRHKTVLATDPKTFEANLQRMRNELKEETEKLHLLKARHAEMFEKRNLSEEKVSSLRKHSESAEDELRAAMQFRIESYGDIRSQRKQVKAEWAEERQKWHGLVGSKKGDLLKEPELVILKEPPSKELHLHMKRLFDSIKAAVEDKEDQLAVLADENKALDVALRHIERNPVDWSVTDERRVRALEEGLFREAEGKERQLDELVDKVVLYLQHGTRLMKYRSFGRPSDKHFFISADRACLCWCDPKDWESAASAQGKDRDKILSKSLKFIPFAEVQMFILGQYSPLFNKYGVAFGSSEFYRSFSLFYGPPHKKQTLDCVAENDADFEAWLIGISAHISVQPRWGSGIDVSAEPCFNELEIDEVEFCQQYHISPYYYRESKAVALQHQKKHGYVTRYDMRLITALDVLRCIKMHDILLARGDIRSRPLVRSGSMPTTPSSNSGSNANVFSPPASAVKRLDIRDEESLEEL